MIDTIETERTFKCDEFMNGVKDEKDKIKMMDKLHRYFGHVSPESLYRLITASV